MNHWTNYLALAGANRDPGTSDTHFGAACADAGTLARDALAVPLFHLGPIRASGEEAVSFLHKLFSNDVNGLAADAVQWGSFNTPQGRMLANFLIWREEDGLTLLPSSELAPALLKKLSLYILRAKVRLSLPEPERALLGLVGPKAGEYLARAALPLPEGDMRHKVSASRRCIRINDRIFLLDLPAAEAPDVFEALRQHGAALGGTADWQLAAIRAGLPLVTRATQEAFVAQMLNFELIGGVSFSKGCYPGQEIIARTQYLGKPKRRLFRISIASPVPADIFCPGAALYAPCFDDGQAAGMVVNAAPLPEGGEALAVIRSEAVRTDGGIRIGSPDGPCVQLLDLPYEVPGFD